MKTHTNKQQEHKNKLPASALSKTESDCKHSVQLMDNRPEAIVQRKIQETIQNNSGVEQLRNYRKITDNNSAGILCKQQTENQTVSQTKPKTIDNLSSLYKPRFVPADIQITKPSLAQPMEVMQAKMYFVSNKHYLADPNELVQHSIDQIQHQFTTDIDSLADNANVAAAMGALNASFAHMASGGANQTYQLTWVGNDAFMEKGANYPGGGQGTRLEKLGSVRDHQDANLYLPHPVGGGRNIYVNRSDRSQKVMDSSGQYMERFVNRSVTQGELGNLSAQNDLQPPGAGNHSLHHWVKWNKKHNCRH